MFKVYNARFCDIYLKNMTEKWYRSILIDEVLDKLQPL
jgi:hypothetical protein